MNKSPKRRPTTGSKGSPRKGDGLNESVVILQDENQQLQFAAGEKDVEIERMKTTLIALNGKLSSLTDIDKEVNDQKSYFKSSETTRGELQIHITDLSQKIRIDTESHDTKHTVNITEINRLRSEIQSIKEEMNQRENEHLKTLEQVNQSHFAELAQKDEQMKKNEREYKDDLTVKEKDHLYNTKTMQEQHSNTVRDLNSQHQAELRELDKEKTRRENEYIQKTNFIQDQNAQKTRSMQDANIQKTKSMEDEFAKKLKDVRDAHEKEMKQAEDRHQNEKRRLEYEMSDQKQRAETKLKAEMDMAAQKLQATIDAHTKENQASNESQTMEMQTTIAKHTEEMRIFRLDQERSDTAHRDLVDKMRADFQKQLNDQQAKHDRENRDRESRHNIDVKERITIQERTERELNLKMEDLRKAKDEIIAGLMQKMDEQRASFESKIDRMTITIETHEKTILVLKSNIQALEEDLYKKRDVEKQLDECLKREQDNQAGRNKLNEELQNATDYILELEEKVYKANKTSLELLKQLKDAEVEIETLKQYIIDLKQRIAVYIPVKEDHIDKKLAEFINNYPERSKLKIMFMRESEGVYQFGTKRVAVKVEKDNIKIRVGGGYLSLDEFLDQYTPVELEKLERKDPLKRFSEKIAVQKTIVNAGVREQSPVRSPHRADSPKKSTR